MHSILKLVLSCIEHPEVSISCYVLGCLTGGTLPKLLQGLLTIINPLVGSAFAAIVFFGKTTLKNLLSKIKL